MARVTSSNYSNPGFQYATIDNEQFDRTDVAGVGQSLENHEHSVGNGLPVARVAANAVTTTAIADSAVTSAKIADGTIATGDLADGAVTQPKLAANSVGTTQLADNGVTTAKIADAQVTTAKMATASIGTAQLVDASVTSAKLASTLAISGALTVASGAGTLSVTFGSASSGAYIASGIPSGNLQFAVAGTVRWQMDFTSGHWIANTDNTTDIGQEGAHRPRNVYVAGGLAIKTKAGAPVDADFTNPIDGMLAVDTTNSRLYVRVGGTWKFTALT